MKKYLIFLLLSLSLISCMGGVQPTKDITVGVILPLTGDFSFFGEHAKAGALIALEEINDPHFRLVFEDDQCMPKKATLSYKKLKDVNNVNLILGPACTGSILAVSEQVKNDHTTMLALLDAGEEIEKQGNHLYALGFSSEEEGYLIADHMIQNNIKKVSILYELDEWASLVKDAFTRRFVSLGGIIIAEEGQDVDNSDYRTNLLKLLKKNPQALYVAPAYNGGFVLKHLKELDKEISVFGPDTFGINEVLTVAEDAAEGVIYSSVVLDEGTEAAKKFQEQYAKRYGEPSESLLYAAFGYDSVKVVYQVLKEGESFEDIKDYDGMIKINHFDQNGMAKMQPILMTIQNRTFVKV